MNLRIVYVSMAWLVSFCSNAQDWEYADTKEGVTVYTREAPGSPIKEFRATTEINASIEELLKIVLDISTYNQWYDHCKSAKVLNREENRITYYMAYQMPFPFSNRDVVNEMIISITETETNLTFSNKEGVLEEQDNVVRMPISEGHWKLVKQSDSVTYIEHQYLGDPAGNVPGGIVNMFLVAGPIHTLSALSQLALSH